MSPRNEDFLFAQEAQRRGYIAEAQLEEGFLLQKRMSEELQIDERLAVILVKRGWLAEEQARRVYARIEPESDTDEIQGYRIIEKIGRGAMGTVYKAMHLGLQRQVAIKVLRRDLARDATQVERLKEEAKLLASLDHPNIVRAIDAGESRGFPFVVMEYVDGETLKERVNRQGPLHEIDALRITRGLADALERARRMGVVHRDVKPGNIILTRKDEPKLMDLGLAKGPVDLGLTQHGATVGTPQFISPEQAQDPRKADTRSDIYSLGATLYAMVTGRPPFQGTTLAEVLTKVLYEAPTPPRVLNKKVSPEVGYLIERMMLKDPALRYRGPSDVVHDIDEILAGRSIIPDGFTGNWEAFLLRKRIRKWMKIGVAAVVSLVVFGTSVWAYLDAQYTREMRAEGKDAIRATILRTAVESVDDELLIREKLLEARKEYEHWVGWDPDGIEALGRHVHHLDLQARQFDAFGKVAKRAKELIDAERYDMAVDRLDEFTKTVIGVDDPARRAAGELREEVVAKSAGTYQDLRSEVLRAAAATLGGLIQRQAAYHDALSQGLFVTPGLRLARVEAKQTVLQLEDAQAKINQLGQAFSAEGLAPKLVDLEFAVIVKGFEDRRGAILDGAERAWTRLEVGDWLRWGIVQPLVEIELGRVERAVDLLIEGRAKQIETEARSLHRLGRTESAKTLLTKLGNAANHAGLPQIRADAVDLRYRIEQEYRMARESAAADLEGIERDVVDMLAEGDTAGIRERVKRTLQERQGNWPIREEVEDLLKLADAFDRLVSAAFDGLVKSLRVDDVLLRDGTTDPRWIIKASDKSKETVLVATSSGRPGRERSLLEVHPDQLEVWAGLELDPMPPLMRAAAKLAALPKEAPRDLRPLVARLGAIVKAFRDASYRGALHDSMEERSKTESSEQRRRETQARVHLTSAKTYYIDYKNPSSARFHLQQLISKLTEYQYTIFFEEHEEEIRAYNDRVEKELANLRLADSFPGAEVGLDGERTWIDFDFENTIQLQVFKEGLGRATGRIEKFANVQKPVTGSPSDHRFRLLWGRKELIRDKPMELPCIFDPAERITVECALYTLDSPFLFAVDIDGLQVGILSADPQVYAGRWEFPPGIPLLDDEDRLPRYNYYGRGRGVTFHTGTGFGDPRTWAWPAEGHGRFWDRWRQSRRMGSDLFAFEPGKTYRLKVVRDAGSLTLYVDDAQVVRKESDQWARIGHFSDRNPKIRGTGTGRIQILTWTPQAIDDLRLTGYVLEKYRAD